MTRIIRIESCKDCHFRDHKGAFGRIGYIPICRNGQSRELPYTASPSGIGGRLYAEVCEGVPGWCPLEKLEAA